MKKTLSVRSSGPYEYHFHADGNLGSEYPMFTMPIEREIDWVDRDQLSSDTQQEWRNNCEMEICEGEVSVNTMSTLTDPERALVCGGQVVCAAKTCRYREDPLENDNEVRTPQPTPPTLSAQAKIPTAN